MAKLGSVCKIVSGGTPKTGKKEYWNGNIKWITPAEIQENDFYIEDSERHITEEGRISAGLKYMPKGTVLLSSRAPIGKVAIVKNEMCCNQGFKNLICSNEIYNEYLYYFLKSHTEYLKSLGRGATFKEISKSIVENIEIPLPDYNQQREIANNLYKLDCIVCRRKTQLKKLDELVKSQFIEMFGGALYPTCHLSDECEIITKGSTPTTIGYNFTDTGINFIKIENITSESKFDKNGMMYINNECNEAMKRSQLKENDILFSIAGAIGRCAIVTENILPANINQALAIVRLKKGTRFNTGFLLATLKSDYIERQYLSLKRGAAQLNLSLKDVGNFIVPVPPIEKQKEFENLFEQADKSKFEIQQSLDKLETLKKSLMQKYFG